jgi:hypothetical protein
LKAGEIFAHLPSAHRQSFPARRRIATRNLQLAFVFKICPFLLVIKLCKAANGIRCKHGLPLQGVLREWVRVNEEFARRGQRFNDVPWWYNERANVSVFAGAVWRNRGRAFEEFSATKRKIGTTTGRLHGSVPGRVDMYFETRDGNEYNLEAKSWVAGAAKAGLDPRPRIKEVA